MQSLRASLARLLICNLLAPAPLLAAEQPATAADKPTRAAYSSSQLQGDQRILQALNRFTFGPRPGDIDTVKSIGLDKWFDQQLHPDAIDNAELNDRLARFPAMQWNTQDLLFRAPSNALIRQTANGTLPIPQNPVLRAVYQNAIYRLQEKKEAKTEKQAATTPNNAQPAAMAPAAADASMNDSKPVAAAPITDPRAMALAARMDMLDDDGPSPAETLLALPPNQRIQRLISMQPAEFEDFVKSLRPVQRQALVADLEPAQRETVAALENPERLVAEELIAQRLTRDIYSSAQLQEVMTDFWLNHFNVYLRKNEQMPYYLVSYERDAIRPRALGKFEDLLEAVAHSPAMLVYLDNAQSIGPDSHGRAARRVRHARAGPTHKRKAPEGLNENYARELMELHTAGRQWRLHPGRCYAGGARAHRLDHRSPAQRRRSFHSTPIAMSPAQRKSSARRSRTTAKWKAASCFTCSPSRPATAQFICRKLAIRFVCDDPPQALVDRMAKTYLSSGGDISAVLKTLFHSPEFWSTIDLPRQGQDAARIRRLRGARLATPTSTTCCRSPTHFARWACRSTARFLPPATTGKRRLGLHRRAGRSHELRAHLAANRLPGITIGMGAAAGRLEFRYCVSARSRSGRGAS